MKKFTKFSLLPLLVLILVGCGSPIEDNLKRHQEFTLADAYKCIEVLDDELEPVAIYTTHACVPEIGPRNDIFIRAFKYKNTGAIEYQIYLAVIGTDWQRPHQLNYKFGGNLISSPALKIDSDVSCSSRTCIHTEVVGFNIREDYLADLSEQYHKVKGTAITFRVGNINVPNQDFLLSAAEMAALYRAVNFEGEYSTKSGTNKPIKIDANAFPLIK